MISETHYEQLREIVECEGIDDVLDALQAIELVQASNKESLSTEPRAYSYAEILDMLARDSDGLERFPRSPK